MSVALIIGAGPKVGAAVGNKFVEAGYKVAVASRSQKLDSKFPFFEFDAAQPSAVPALFEKVAKVVGIPGVVVYNAYSISGGVPGSNFDANDFEAGIKINTVTPATVVHETVKGFDSLAAQGKLGPEGATFIFTGNAGNERTFAGHMALTVGKAASANFVEYMATHEAKGRPYKFYYADERTETGMPMIKGVTAEPHAIEFLKLAQDPQQQPWQYTFVEGKGYVHFPRL